MIKSIIFDLNKVLIDFDKSDTLYLENFGISRLDFWSNREIELERYALGEITLNDLLISQMKKAGIPLNKLEIARKIHDNGLLLVDGMLEILEKTSKKYKLILMAGEGKESLDLKIGKFNLKNYFTKVYATCISKMKKTDEMFYKLILNESNLLPQEVLFIDDRIPYIETARKLGIRTIHFIDSKQLAKELDKI